MHSLASAHAAWSEGEAAGARGDWARARRWFGRAHRLAPDDDQVTLALGLAALHDGAPREAIALLSDVATRHDRRAVWLALAAAHRGAGEVEAAAGALGHALSAHVWTRAEARRGRELDLLAAATQRPGWCALAADGTLLVHAPKHPDLSLALDGKPVRWRAATLRLPERWRRADLLSVSSEGSALLGSPIQIRRLRRLEGYVEVRGERIAGWAWHPGDAEADPILSITSRGRKTLARTIVAHEPSSPTDPEGGDGGWRGELRWGPLARVRAFTVPISQFRHVVGPSAVIAIRDRDGRELPGSPLYLRRPVNPASRGCTLWCAARPRAAEPAKTVDVILAAREGVLPSVRSVLAHLPEFARIIVVYGDSPGRDDVARLQALAATGRVTLLRIPRGRGFAASGNRGIRAARPEADLILLDAGALVEGQWIEGLRAALARIADAGTATPLSNEASILGYPEIEARNPSLSARARARLAACAARLFAGESVEIPAVVEPCLYIRNRCSREVGALQEDGFARGYGAHGDFSLRARALGWRHIGVPGVYVRGAPADVAEAALRARDASLLERLHPGYAAALATQRSADPLFSFRRRLDAARFASRRNGRGVAILITHGRGGGVLRVVRDRARAFRENGLRPIVLFPVHSGGITKEALVAEGTRREYPNLRFAIPDEFDALVGLLAAQVPRALECHHLLGHDHRLLELAPRLGIPLDIFVHDYAAFCTRITLVGADGSYCGAGGRRACGGCAEEGSDELEEAITPRDLAQRSALEFGRARRVLVPSRDTAVRLHAHFPRLDPVIAPLERNVRWPPLKAQAFGRERVICVIGAIGTAKGYDVLLEAARDSARRDLPLRFELVGYSRDDAPLLATGRVFITGAHRYDEAQALIAATHADFAFLPSIWPETWCFALSEAWRAGLGVAAFALGAQAERIRATGRGWLLPLGLAAPALNDALLDLRPPVPAIAILAEPTRVERSRDPAATREHA